MTTLLKKIRTGETFETSHAELNFFLYQLEQDPEHRPVKFSVEIDGEIITVRPTKPPEFYTTFKLFTTVLVSVNLFNATRSWLKRGRTRTRD